MIDKDLKNAKILIVDDLKSNIEVIMGILELSGYKNIEHTTDSRKVIGLVKTFNPDLILLDLMMPYLSGFDVMDLIRAEKQYSFLQNNYLPILVLTADNSNEIRLKALAGGAKDFLSKPFDIIEVKLRIKNLLETQYLFQLLKVKNQTLEDKVVSFLKLNNDWYK